MFKFQTLAGRATLIAFLALGLMPVFGLAFDDEGPSSSEPLTTGEWWFVGGVVGGALVLALLVVILIVRAVVRATEKRNKHL